jgi:hypothetical protein
MNLVTQNTDFSVLFFFSFLIGSKLNEESNGGKRETRPWLITPIK